MRNERLTLLARFASVHRIVRCWMEAFRIEVYPRKCKLAHLLQWQRRQRWRQSGTVKILLKLRTASKQSDNTDPHKAPFVLNLSETWENRVLRWDYSHCLILCDFLYHSSGEESQKGARCDSAQRFKIMIVKGKQLKESCLNGLPIPMLKTPPNFSTTKTNPKQTHPEDGFKLLISCVGSLQAFLPILNVRIFMMLLAFFSDAFGMYGRRKSS